MWIVFGVLSVIFAVMTIVFAYRRNSRFIWTEIAGLSFTALTTLAEYALVNKWVQKGDWSALMDVVPSMYTYLTGYTLVMIFLHVVAMFIYHKQHNM